MAERQPSKLNVAGSIPVSRSTLSARETRRRRRLAIARAAAWVELAIGTIGVLLISLILIAAPKYSRPLLAEPPLDPSAVVGAILAVAGYAWMLRIFFARPEPDAPPWRCRAEGGLISLVP